MTTTRQQFLNLLNDYQSLVKSNENKSIEEIPYLFLDLISNTGSIIELTQYKDFDKDEICENIKNLLYCLTNMTHKLDFDINEVMNILDPISVNTDLHNVNNNLKYISYINGKVGDEVKFFCINKEMKNGFYNIKNRIMEIIVVLRNISNLLNINLNDLKIKHWYY